MRFFKDDTNDDQTDDATRLQMLRERVTNGLRNFELVGQSLEEIRDTELYRLEAETFDAFCRSNWHLSERHAERLIAAAALCRNLGTTGETPPTERHARPLTKLPLSEAREAWTEAQADGGSLPAIEAAVEKRRPTRGSKKSRKRPIRFRVPGASVVIEPNSKFRGAEQSLLDALSKLEAKNKAA